MSLLFAILRLRCPKCGRGALFKGLLAVKERCDVCGFDLRAQDSADGPAFFALVIVGFAAMGVLVWLEMVFTLPLWQELAILTTVTLGGTFAVLRLSKSALIALQYKRVANAHNEKYH